MRKIRTQINYLYGYFFQTRNRSFYRMIARQYQVSAFDVYCIAHGKGSHRPIEIRIREDLENRGVIDKISYNRKP